MSKEHVLQTHSASTGISDPVGVGGTLCPLPTAPGFGWYSQLTLSRQTRLQHSKLGLGRQMKHCACISNISHFFIHSGETTTSMRTYLS